MGSELNAPGAPDDAMEAYEVLSDPVLRAQYDVLDSGVQAALAATPAGWRGGNQRRLVTAAAAPAGKLQPGILEGLYEKISAVRPHGKEAPPSERPFLVLRSRILERIALSERCRGREANGAPSRCCSLSLTQTAAGCLSRAIALAKLAGDFDRARELYEVSVDPLRPAAVEGTPKEGAAGVMTRPPEPIAEWPSFWQTCELFIPALAGASGAFGPFWDPQDPALRPVSKLLGSFGNQFRADLERLLAAGPSRGFAEAFPALVEEGHWDRVVLYSGTVGGWNQEWCGPQAAPPLQICSLLRGVLPGESHGLLRHYLLDNNEEVSISRLSGPRTRLRPHNAGTNAKINLEVPLTSVAGATLRVGGRERRWGTGSAFAAESSGEGILAYDACFDRELAYEGAVPFYLLEVGVLHPLYVKDLTAKQRRGEL